MCCDTYTIVVCVQYCGGPDGPAPTRYSHGSLGVVTFELDPEGTVRGSRRTQEFSGSVGQKLGKCRVHGGLQEYSVLREIKSSQPRRSSVLDADRGHLSHWPGTSYQ